MLGKHLISRSPPDDQIAAARDGAYKSLPLQPGQRSSYRRAADLERCGYDGIAQHSAGRQRAQFDRCAENV